MATHRAMRRAESLPPFQNGRRQPAEQVWSRPAWSGGIGSGEGASRLLPRVVQAKAFIGQHGAIPDKRPLAFRRTVRHSDCPLRALPRMPLSKERLAAD